MEEEGYQVQVFETFAGIKLALASGAPDLLLIDFRLPDENGMDFCRELKGQQAFSGTAFHQADHTTKTRSDSY